MKINAYTTRQIQQGDVVLGYNSDNPQETLGFTGLGNSDNSLTSIDVVLTKSQITSLHTTPVDIIQPPDGYGVQVIHPPVLIVDNGGTPFIFASGQTVDIINESLSTATISSFNDAAITSNPVSVGGFYFAYDIIIDSPVKISATAAISGGGDADEAKFTFLVDYRLISL